eukprot:Blabericola_migrator_1__13225@NODE_917_length_6065_cov_346_982161_g638_i0_p3_GENE_NODE_917_length_6065_cov_346_982161_g638_i0NODE_917_length_6065_cov_346_982161_g638_i0_p3_ORF_typecomplete_len289_score36_91VWA/PF00092_28/0_0001VWA_2/PF13519_6/0_00029_NODE_917_length_6065_cov_346_982161_g638_i08051671
MKYTFPLSLAGALLVALSTANPYNSCKGADIVFVHDSQANNGYATLVLQSQINNLMSSLSSIYSGARFGLVSVSEQASSGCVQVRQSLTQKKSKFKKAVSQLTATVTPTTPGYGAPLTGLVASVLGDLEWESNNRAIIIITNNAPLESNLTDWSLDEECGHATWLPIADLVTLADAAHVMTLLPSRDTSDTAFQYWAQFHRQVYGSDEWLMSLNSSIAREMASRKLSINKMKPSKCWYNDKHQDSDTSDTHTSDHTSDSDFHHHKKASFLTERALRHSGSEQLAASAI